MRRLWLLLLLAGLAALACGGGGGELALPLRPDERAIYVINADGSGLRKLFAESGFAGLAVHPDGNRFAVSFMTDENSTLYLVDVDDGSRKILLHERGYITSQSWSPDGRWLVVLEDDLSSAGARLAVYSPEDGSLRRVDRAQDAVFVAWTLAGDAFYARADYNPDELIRVELPSLTVQTIGRAQADDIAVSPDGELLALASYAEDQGVQPGPPSVSYTIDIARADGSDRRELLRLDDTPIVSGLSWSPDGGRLAYSPVTIADKETGFRSGVYVVDVESGERTRLTDAPEGVDIRADWSPDGRHLLVFRHVCTQCDGPGSKVVLASADGSPEVTLPGNEAFQAAEGAWSPDGARFAYSADALYVADAAGGDVRTILDLPGSAYTQLSWSSDGERIFFVREPELAAIIYAVRPDGSDLEVLDVPLQSGVVALAVAPDGETFGGVRADGTLFLLTAGGSLVDVSSEALAGAGPGQIDPSRLSWSPDSTVLAIDAGGEKGGERVTLVDLGGTVRMVDTPGRGRPARWSPDGTQLAYWADGAVWAVDPQAAGEPHRIAPAPSTTGVDWSPDGREIAFHSEASVVAAEIDRPGERRVLFPADLGTESTEVRWSPDGTRIAVGNYAALIVGELSDGRSHLAAESVEMSGLEWTQDSSRLVYAARSADGSKQGLFVADGRGGDPAALTDSFGRLHVVVARLDDGRIVFRSAWVL